MNFKIGNQTLKEFLRDSFFREIKIREGLGQKEKVKKLEKEMGKKLGHTRRFLEVDDVLRLTAPEWKAEEKLRKRLEKQAGRDLKRDLEKGLY